MTYRGADPTAVMGRRIVAYLIDGVLAFAVMFAVMYPLWQSTSVTAPAGTVECGSGSDDSVGSDEFRPGVRTNLDVSICFQNGDEVRYIPAGKEGQFFGTLGLVSGGTSFVMLILLQGLVGASPGKLVAGLRVVKEDGSNAGIGRCVVRTILLPLDSAFCFLVGLLTAFNSQRHRRVGDMVASTMVISRSDQDALVLARSGQTLPGDSPTRPAAPSAWATPPTSLTPPTSAPAPEGGPTWDPARNSYLQYDQAGGAWMQYDDDTKQWKAIDT